MGLAEGLLGEGEYSVQSPGVPLASHDGVLPVTMTDQEINEAVARKLGTFQEGALYYDLPDYCHSIEAAWEIVESEKGKHFFEIHETPEGWIAIFCPVVGTWKQMTRGEVDAAPMAICKAFLKLQEGK